MKDLFVTALDISLQQHAKIQASFQNYSDTAVSKKINLPNNATMKDILNLCNMTYDLKCKGVMVFQVWNRKPGALMGNEEMMPGCPYCG